MLNPFNTVKRLLGFILFLNGNDLTTSNYSKNFYYLKQHSHINFMLLLRKIYENFIIYQQIKT